jgi:hypothetical protein
MEAMYFAVGVLTMVLLAVASLAVYSTVMVLKLKNRIEEVLRYTHDETNNIYRNINEREDQGQRNLSEVNDHIHRNLDELRSYVDRRFDKLIDTYILVKETEQESKKLIKG